MSEATPRSNFKRMRVYVEMACKYLQKQIYEKFVVKNFSDIPLYRDAVMFFNLHAPS